MTRFLSRTLFAVAMVMLVCAVANAQRGGGRGGGRGDFGGGRGGFGFGGFPGGFGGSGGLAVIQRNDVQSELELTDDQKNEIQDLVEGRERPDFARFRDMSNEERREAFTKMREERQERAKEAAAKIKDILNSSQYARFNQLSFQLAVQQSQTESAVAAAGVELDESAREKLRNAQQEISEETRAKIAKIQREAQIAILKTVLSTDKIEELMSDEFTFERPQRGNFGRGGAGFGGGGRGGAGGNRRPVRPSADGDSDADSDSGNTRRRRR